MATAERRVDLSCTTAARWQRRAQRRREVARRDHRFTFAAAGGELARELAPTVILLTPVDSAALRKMPVDRSPLLPAGDDSAPRIKLVDNMKAALICCVVLYHGGGLHLADRPRVAHPRLRA